MATYRCELSRIDLEPAELFVSRKVQLTAAGDRAIADVARLMELRPDLLLLRVEVYATGGRASASSAQRRQLLDRSQARADFVLRRLWRGHGVWAERLDAVGYGVERNTAEGVTHGGGNGTWRVHLVVAQRAP